MQSDSTESLTPSEVRTLIVKGHDELRERIHKLSITAHEVLENMGKSDRLLRSELAALLEMVEEHMQLEERVLLPALRETDSWGEERVERFQAEHARQYEIIAELLGSLEQARPFGLALITCGFIDLLQRDMREEESTSLTGRVLRDDLTTLFP